MIIPETKKNEILRDTPWLAEVDWNELKDCKKTVETI